MPAVAAAGLVGSLALATPAAADPASDASTKADIKPLVLDRIPADGSDPSATKTIWVDFDGGTVSGKTWNDRGNDGKDITYEPAASLSDAQKLVVYQRVVQAYAPFDVNVTTKKPSAGDLRRSNMDDDRYGAIIHITDSNASSPGFEQIFGIGAAGIASRNGFGDPYLYDAWATTDLFTSDQEQTKKIRLGQKAQEQQTMASIEDRLRAYELGSNAVHEIGHTLGLTHHGYGDEEYYRPGSQLDAPTIWAPNMGNALAAGMERWSKAYPGGNNKQDDLAVLTDDLSKSESEDRRAYDGDRFWAGKYCTYTNSDKIVKADGDECLEDEPLRWQSDYNGRLDYRENQEANRDATARVLTIDGGKASAWGEFVRDLGSGVGNWYRFDAAPGPITVSATPQAPYSSLDLKVTLYDSALNQIATANPGLKNQYDSDRVRIPGVLEGQNASVGHVGTGNQTYFVKVEQGSFGDMDDNTSDRTVASPTYAGLGTFQLAVEGTATQELASPMPDATYGEVVTGTGIAGATVDVDTANGKLIGSAQVGPDGKFEVKLDPAAKVGDELLVSQSKDGLKSRPAAVTVITEEKPEVKVKVDPSKITEGDDGGVTVVGTGFAAGQKVSGVVNSEPVELGTKIADDDGKVEFVFDASKLEVGKHKVTLTADDDKDYTGSANLTVVKADDDEPSPEPSDDETPSPEPSDDETPSPEPSDDESMPPPSDGDDNGNDDGGLPSTGASTALTLFGIGGLVLVGSGVTIAAAARRRNKA